MRGFFVPFVAVVAVEVQQARAAQAVPRGGVEVARLMACRLCFVVAWLRCCTLHPIGAQIGLFVELVRVEALHPPHHTPREILHQHTPKATTRADAMRAGFFVCGGFVPAWVSLHGAPLMACTVGELHPSPFTTRRPERPTREGGGATEGHPRGGRGVIFERFRAANLAPLQKICTAFFFKKPTFAAGGASSASFNFPFSYL